VGRLGFTGTRRGMNTAQLASVARLFVEIAEANVLHHGDCVGADEQAHGLATRAGLFIEIHPPTDDAMRARCTGCVVATHDPLPYLERNRAIVDACDLLIAAPHGPEEQRSGTWSTVRYARKVGRPVVVVWPDGRETK
jgi:hypothetical protein